MARVMLDTNLWSYLARETTADVLYPAVSKLRHRIVIPPLTLGELLDTGDVAQRDRSVSLVAVAESDKLDNTIDYQAQELTEEIRRLRPEWLRSIPKTDRLHSFRSYWDSVYWREAKREPDVVVARRRASSRQTQGEDEVLRVQTANRKGWPFLDGDLDSAAIAGTTAEDHPDPDPGSSAGWPPGTSVLWWRVVARDVWWFQLRAETALLAPQRDKTFSDYLGAYVDVPAMLTDRASFNRFFLFDIEGWNVPHTWWHGTVEIVQLGSKIKPSNGEDAAFASLLPECDYLLTADKDLARIVTAASRALGAPAGGVVVKVEPPRDGGWLDVVLGKLADLPPPRNASPSRLVPDGPGIEVGTGPGMVSPSEAHRATRRRPSNITVEGAVRVTSTSTAHVADMVAWLSTSPKDAPSNLRPGRFWGALATSKNEDVSALFPKGTIARVEWISPADAKPLDVYIESWNATGTEATVAGSGRLV